MRNQHLLALYVISLSACGGGSGPSEYQQALERAQQLEAQARVLGVNSPCQQAGHCGLLTFLEPSACPKQTYQIYSTISPTAAAASAAAGEQVHAAQQAIALNPGPPALCPLFAVAPPIPACVATVCQAAK